MLSRDISACRHLRITSRKKTARDGCYKTATPTTINVSTWYVEIAPDWKQFSTPKEIDRDARAREIRDAIYIPSVCDCDSRAPLHKTTTASRRAAAWLESTTYVRPTPRHLPRRPRPPYPWPRFLRSRNLKSVLDGVCRQSRHGLRRAWRRALAPSRCGPPPERGSSPPPCKGRASPP